MGVYGLYKLLQRLRSGAYLQDAVVVITGATSGLGKECATVSYAAGSHLVLCGRDEERLKQGPTFRSLMDKNTAEGRTPEEVALTVLHAVGEGRKELLVAGLVPTLAVYLRTLAPTLFFSIMSVRAKRIHNAEN